ncbi:hypothetical protein BDN67DRAFT_984056 [Paxillus ammoniavirescens]|nr:hypothetical protein BDN67DRAFT_984056 [Paxillus ammoniavirescens]
MQDVPIPLHSIPQTPTRPQTDGGASLETELDEFGLPPLPPDLDSTELGIGDMSPLSAWNSSSAMTFTPTSSAENQVDISSVLPLLHPDSTPVPPEMFLTPLFTVLKQSSESLAMGGTGDFKGTQSAPFMLQPKSSVTPHLHVPISNMSSTGPPVVSTPATLNDDTDHGAGPAKKKRRTIPNNNDTSTGNDLSTGALCHTS